MSLFQIDYYSLNTSSCGSIAECISASIACCTFILAIISLLLAYGEYKKRQKYERNEVLMRYNERYESNQSIQKIISHYSNRRLWGQQKQDDSQPTVNDKELFLRFFEELNMMVDSGYLNIKEVSDMFAFYFVVAWNDDRWFWDKYMLNPHESMNEVHQSGDWHSVKSFYSKVKKTDICKEALDFLESYKQGK